MADVLPHDASFLGHFDAARPTLVGMHGWNGQTDGGRAQIQNISNDLNLQILDFIHRLADDVLAKGDYNALFVDWGPLATWDNYFQGRQLSVQLYTYEYLISTCQCLQ